MAAVQASPRSTISVVMESAQEHLNAQGVPMWPELSPTDPFPIFSAALPPTVVKRIAGNVT